MGGLVILCGEGLLLTPGEAPLERASVADSAAEALARLNGAGAVCVLVSAPPGAAKPPDPGLLARLHERLRDGLARRGARVEAILTTAGPQDLATSFRDALERFRGRPAASPVLCESMPALEAAAAVGCPRVLLRTPAGRAVQAQGIPDRLLPVAVHADLAAAVDPVLRLLR